MRIFTAYKCSSSLVIKIAAAFMLLAMFSLQALAVSTKNLPKTYKEWLEKDVRWIITNDERDAFLNLTDDDARNKFIEEFWEVRNPTPGAPNNPYKEEHYKRLAYAIQYFSTGAQDGYKTDRGQVYITLGEPQQRAHYNHAETRPMEIWFYQNTHPALPTYFYVVFYQKDVTSDFKLYSPYFDGPRALVTSHHAENGPVEAVQAVDRDLGREVARTTLSLIPGEPTSMTDPTPSLESDTMLSVLKNLRNHPFTIDELNLHRNLAHVTTRIILPGEYLNVTTAALRNGRGDVNLHYAVRLNKAEDFAVAQADERYYYSVEMLARVMNAEGKEVYSQLKKASAYLSKGEIATVQSRPFGYEGWLPLAPGKYKLEFLLTNVLKKTTFKSQKEVTIPEPPKSGLQVGDVVPFISAESVPQTEAGLMPFNFGDVKFTPYVAPDVSVNPGQDMQIFYQIWAPPVNPATYKGKFLSVDYVYGQPALAGSTKTIHDQVQKEQFDGGGSLLNGKKIPTSELPAGNYRMAITVSDPETHARTATTFNFRVLSNSGAPTTAWDISDPELARYVTSGGADFDRGLAYLTAGNQAAAADHFRASLEKNPNNQIVRARLVEYYFGQQNFAQVAKLYDHIAVTKETQEDTVLRVADSLDKTGNVKQAADFLESALSIKGPSGPMYLTLASYYQKMGNAQKAEENDRKGKSLMRMATPAS
jgi:GWxTD domain-containing protein